MVVVFVCAVIVVVVVVGYETVQIMGGYYFFYQFSRVLFYLPLMCRHGFHGPRNLVPSRLTSATLSLHTRVFHSLTYSMIC